MASRSPKSNDDDGFITVARPNRSRSNQSTDSTKSVHKGKGQGQGQGQGHGQHGGHKRGESKEEREAREKTEKFNKASKTFEDLVKNESERQVKFAFKEKVSEITPERVKEIIASVLLVCERHDHQSLGIEKDELPQKVKVTVLGRIIKLVPLMGTDFCAYIKTLEKLIREINGSEKCSDYVFLNHFSWPQWPDDPAEKKVLMDAIDHEEYRSAFESLIELYGCDVRAKNVKGETALQAYEKAVKHGAAPDCPGVREVLNGKISQKNLIKMMCNMMNVIKPDTAAKFGNTFKLGMLYGMSALVAIILDQILKIRPEAGTAGYFPQIQELLKMCRTMAVNPIIANEWKRTLEEDHKSSDYNDELERFANDLIAAAKNKLRDVEEGKLDEEQLMYVTPRTLPGVIIEASKFIGLNISEVYGDFVIPRLSEMKTNDSKRALHQSMILVATSHAIQSLDKENKHQLLDVLTPDILRKMNELITGKQISAYGAAQIESMIGTFLGIGQKLASRDLTEICALPCLQQVVVHTQTQTQTQTQVPVQRRGKNKKGSKKPKASNLVGSEPDDSGCQMVPERQVSPESQVDDLLTFINLKEYESKAPGFLATIDSSTKNSDGSWADEKVDDWVYGLSMTYKRKEPGPGPSQLLPKELLPTIVFVTSNDIIMQGTNSERVTQKLNFLKLLLDETFGTQVFESLQVFAKSIGTDPDAMGFESEFNATTFKQFMQLYEITI